MTVAREYHTSQVHYLRKTVALADLTSATAVVIGTVPEGAIVADAYAVVTTAFDSGTSDLLDMGNPDDPNGFMTAVSIASVGKKSADELATSNDIGPYTAATDISATWTADGTAASAGEMTLVVEYLADLG